MPTKVQIRWSVDSDLSCMHANYVVAAGAHCTDPKTEQALSKPVTEINQRLLGQSLDIAEFWNQLQLETLSGNKRAVELALANSGCSELQLESIASAIQKRLSDTRQLFKKRFPRLDEQLELRGRPLRQMWDTCGPGLLAKIASLIWETSPPEQWWPKKVDGVLVQPVRGGDGGIEPNANRFWIEAMLTDANPDVPEVLRVAFLVTQLALESHLREKSSERSSLPWTIALVPIVLAAGKHLDVIRSSELPIHEAVDAWRVCDPTTADTLAAWWPKWHGTNNPIPVGLKQLAHSIAEANARQLQRPAISESDEFDD